MKISALPFVNFENDKSDYWNVEETDDYKKACEIGVEYADIFLEYIRSRSGPSVVLSNISRDMAKHERGTPMFGYQVGFFARLEDELMM